MKRILAFLFLLLAVGAAKAQIGYQVSLIDQATGKPKANATVTVSVTISNNVGQTICSETQSATSNEAGVLSLSVGNADTFINMDWSKLPLWVSASVGGVTIGKSQILSVPVAEYAKVSGSSNSTKSNSLNLNDVVGRWSGSDFVCAISESRVTISWYGDDYSYYYSIKGVGKDTIIANRSEGSDLLITFDSERKVAFVSDFERVITR